MTALNIESIAESLTNCLLGGRSESPPSITAEIRPPVMDESPEKNGVMVDLNSEVSLPYQWEQCLDLRSGDVYYINWKDGTRTSEDPRRKIRVPAIHFSSEEEISDEEGDESEEENEFDCDADDSSSSIGEEDLAGGASPSNSDSRIATAGSHVLVAAGCKSCFMYFMVPKRVDSCPKCAGFLLHLGRNGYY